MENSDQKKNCISLFDSINMSLLKAKAITFLMACAAKDGTFKCSEEMAWASQIVDDLIDDALSAAEQLAKTGEGSA